MPSIYVHNYFAKELKNKIDELKVYKISDPTYLYVFAQSFDNLFYYNFFRKKGHEYRRIGHYAHVHDTWKYFYNLVTYIKDNNLYDDEHLGYLYGSLSHYALDSTCHPYIHYISGRYSKRNKEETRKYLGYHAINEIMLDAIYYYKNNNKKYYFYKLYKDIIPKLTFSDNLKKTIDYTFNKTFNIENTGIIFNKAYNQSRKAYKYLMFDRFGAKKRLYKIVDFFFKNKNFKAYSYSHHVKHIDLNVLNLNHDVWHHPVTNEIHKESFEDLYKISMDKTIKYVKGVNDYFNNKIDIKKLEKIIENNSYSTGLDSDLRSETKYFKF